jgi:small subunit ribosomal protein S4
MGDPKFTKKKFSAPPHPWQKSRIDEEKQLIKEFGLKNKKEVWKMSTIAKNFADQAKKLTASRTEQSKKETEQLLGKLYSLSLLPKGSSVDDVLGLTIKDILERRLQTLVFKKGLARSVTQARQFITHRHITVAGKIITSPSYIVSSAEEAGISFIVKSALADADHPERSVEKQVQKPKKVAKAGEKKEDVKGKKKEEKAEAAKGEKEKVVEKKEKPTKKPEQKEKAESKPAEKEQAPAESKEEKPEEKK